MKIKYLLLTALSGWITFASAHAADQLNILVIMADDVGYMNVAS